MENEKNSLLPVESTGLTPAEKKKVQEENISNSLTEIFNLDPVVKADAVKLVNKYQMRHGMASSIPIICKGRKCPYYDVCQVPVQHRIVGTRCLQEIGVMLSRFESLCSELGVSDEDAVDLGMIKDIVDIEVLILRADNRIALSADILMQAIAHVDHQGQEHFEDIVDPAISLKMSLLDRKMKLLEKLNSTRKDKAAEMKKKKDPSIRAANLMAKVKMMSAIAQSQDVQVTDNDVVKESVIEYTEIEIDNDQIDYDDEESI